MAKLDEDAARRNTLLAAYLFGRFDDIPPLDRNAVEIRKLLEDFDSKTEHELELLFTEWWGSDWGTIFGTGRDGADPIVSPGSTLTNS